MNNVQDGYAEDDRKYAKQVERYKDRK